MPETPIALLQRVRAIMPELEVEHIERNQEGLINEVAIVNQAYVFRFARNEQYARLLEVESKILDIIRPRIGVSAPAPIYQDSECMVYPLLSGQPLSHQTVVAWEESIQNKIAGQLGSLLHRLHSTKINQDVWEIPPTPAPGKAGKMVGFAGENQGPDFPIVAEVSNPMGGSPV